MIYDTNTRLKCTINCYVDTKFGFYKVAIVRIE